MWQGGGNETRWIQWRSSFRRTTPGKQKTRKFAYSQIVIFRENRQELRCLDPKIMMLEQQSKKPQIWLAKHLHFPTNWQRVFDLDPKLMIFSANGRFWFKTRRPFILSTSAMMRGLPYIVMTCRNHYVNIEVARKPFCVRVTRNHTSNITNMKTCIHIIV